MSSTKIVSMTVEKKRLPLGEFSSSRINTLGFISNRNATKNSTTLPSIKTLINYTPTADLPSIEISGGTAKSSPLNTQDLGKISEKLRVRLQLAYFKLKTNQTNVKFRELKRNVESQRNAITKKKTPLLQQSHTTKRNKKRKLLVSHGNYRTPLKSSGNNNINYNNCIAKAFTIESNDFLQFGSSIAGTITTTPINKSKGCLSFQQNQDTPMSVKAAKSLIHLFTSSHS